MTLISERTHSGRTIQIPVYLPGYVLGSTWSVGPRETGRPSSHPGGHQMTTNLSGSTATHPSVPGCSLSRSRTHSESRPSCATGCTGGRRTVSSDTSRANGTASSHPTISSGDSRRAAKQWTRPSSAGVLNCAVRGRVPTLAHHPPEYSPIRGVIPDGSGLGHSAVPTAHESMTTLRSHEPCGPLGV